MIGLGDRTVPTGLFMAEPIAVRAPDAARLLGVSARTFRRLDAAGLLPASIRLGRLHRWSVAELAAWVDSNCPSRAAWMQMRQRTRSH